ncbi:MAG TPA: DNA topoisomerase IV subunit A [Candidatus Nanopelagicaceae bacterium]|nr:DNA topoisomerase IV subunit A [Candidatus Nanopelagicaceae bacterium]
MSKQTTPAAGSHPGRVIDIDVKTEMEGSFLEYAYSVIYARALPDARDGLKPVHRRILHQMSEMGLRPERGHVKSARVVGEVMGKLHPHGDGAIYDTLVRMAQSFSMRLPLIDGHGNFGSLDSGPAAMRYSEARLAKAAMAMVEGTDEDTVDFGANYDGALTEPSVLPAAFPNLLVNGATGIAVGMATNMAPHNLIEVVAAARHLLAHPKATLQELMQYVPGPDLPTGGKIVGLDGIRDAYETGRGSFRMRATTRIENVSAKKRGIVVTELPYSVGPERVLGKIADLVRSKKLQGISDVIDLTDGQNGTRLVIEIKNGFHPEAVLEDLFKLTPMEETFSINAVALVHGQPQTLGLKSLLDVYLTHRIEVTRRRSEFRRRRADERLHLVDGLLIAIVDIDQVIQLIRTSDDANAAKAKLIANFKLTDTQATYILDMPLRRLTKFSRIELEGEQKELRDRIQDLTNLLDSEKAMRALVSDELAAVAKNFGTPRRTVLLESSGVATISVPLEVADGPTRILLSATGLIARTADLADLPATIWQSERARHDVIASSVVTTAHGDLGVITSHGKIHRLRAIDLPVIPPLVSGTSLAGGAPLAEILRLEKGERAIALACLSEDGEGIALATSLGIIKRVQPEVLVNKNEWEIISLKPKDEVVGAIQLTTGNEELVFITNDAQLLHFNVSAVRAQGRAAGGIAGISLSSGSAVTYFNAFMPSEKDVVITISAPSDALPGTAGSIKVSDFAEFPGKGRATGGVRAHRFLKGEDQIVAAYAGPTPIRATSANGTAIEIGLTLSKRDASGSPVPGPISAIAGPVE